MSSGVALEYEECQHKYEAKQPNIHKPQNLGSMSLIDQTYMHIDIKLN